MKINGEKVISFDISNGMFTTEHGSTWYFCSGVNVELEDHKCEESSKHNPLDFVKEGMTSDDLVKLKNAGII